MSTNSLKKVFFPWRVCITISRARDYHKMALAHNFYANFFLLYISFSLFSPPHSRLKHCLFLWENLSIPSVYLSICWMKLRNKYRYGAPRHSIVRQIRQRERVGFPSNLEKFLPRIPVISKDTANINKLSHLCPLLPLRELINTPWCHEKIFAIAVAISISERSSVRINVILMVLF